MSVNEGQRRTDGARSEDEPGQLYDHAHHLPKGLFAALGIGSLVIGLALQAKRSAPNSLQVDGIAERTRPVAIEKN